MGPLHNSMFSDLEINSMETNTQTWTASPSRPEWPIIVCCAWRASNLHAFHNVSIKLHGFNFTHFVFVFVFFCLSFYSLDVFLFFSQASLERQPCATPSIVTSFCLVRLCSESGTHTHTDGVECVESPEVVTAAQEPLRLGTREIEVVLLTGKWLRRGDDLLPGS